jgi:serine/threonine-protein kinase
MSKPKPDLRLWQELSPYLDHALEMDDVGRAAWLASIREQNPTLARELETLLDDYRVLQEERFLEQPSLMLPVHPTMAGQTIGAYKLIEPIGQGGMGSVWLAERSDGRFERRAAVKFLNIALAGSGAGERFKREGTILGRLAHPHIAQLLDAGVGGSGQPYLVLEHVSGEHIDRYCDVGALDIKSRVRLFIDVLAAVAHAHANLIVHRDIKASNVLVSAEGQVKLLDFGIAKLLENEGQPDAVTILTGNAGSAMTLLYATPEQVTGGTVTTATDVYALGVLLYVLLAGQHPAGPGPHSSADLIKNIVDIEPTRLSDVIARTPAEDAKKIATGRATTSDKLRRLLRGDLDTIVAKALKKNPRERYASVTAFAEDLRRYMEQEPIAARPETITYRATKFARRNRTAVALATLALITSFAGLIGTTIQARTANRERNIAQRRFNDVRQLANKLFDIDVRVRRLPGASDTRQFIVDTSLEYLRRLTDDVHDDSDLALEVGTAYMRVGRVQGVPINTNLGQPENAEQNLRKAEQLIASVLKAQPANRMAFLRAAQIAHDRMVLAEYRRPDTAALPLSYESERWLQKYLSTGPIDEAEKNQVAVVGMNVANWYIKKDRTEDGLRLIRQTIEIAKATNQPGQAGSGSIVVARALRRAGDLEGALEAIREGLKLFAPNQPAASAYQLALATHAAILGEDDAISLGRSQEAVEYFERALTIAVNTARQDPKDALTRYAIGDYGTQLAGILRHSDPHRALALYDQALGAYAEIKDDPRVRRDEVRPLVRSTYPLMQIGSAAEARKRLDAAFSRLTELKLYPAEQIELRSEADQTIRAHAEFEAARGDVRHGIEIYQELLAKIMASNPKPQNQLEDATALSNIYRATAQLHRRVKQSSLASSYESRRLELWQHWDRKLPNNSFVRRQIAAVSFSASQ